MLTTLTNEIQPNDAIGSIRSRSLSPREAAVLLGYDLDYVYKLIWAGRLAAQKVDGAWQVSATAVEARLARV
jgi:excisionase family DNA binding protein